MTFLVPALLLAQLPAASPAVIRRMQRTPMCDKALAPFLQTEAAIQKEYHEQRVTNPISPSYARLCQSGPVLRRPVSGLHAHRLMEWRQG